MKSENATPQEAYGNATVGSAVVGQTLPAGVAPNTQHSEGAILSDDELHDLTCAATREAEFVDRLNAALKITDSYEAIRAQLEEAREENRQLRRLIDRGTSISEYERRQSERAGRAEAALEEARRELENADPNQLGEGTLAIKIKRLVAAHKIAEENFRVTNAALVDYDNKRRAAESALREATNKALDAAAAALSKKIVEECDNGMFVCRKPAEAIDDCVDLVLSLKTPPVEG